MSDPPRAPRFLGIDDGPFAFSDAACLVVGVVTRGSGVVEGVMTTRVAVDGRDATDRLLAMLSGSRHAPGLAAVLLDGVTLGGFNVVDGARLHAALSLPVVALVRHEPDAAATRAALEGRWPDWEERWRLIRAVPVRPVALPAGTLWGSWWGVADADVPRLVRTATVEGNWPECLRLAHMIGQAVEKGESRNKA